MCQAFSKDKATKYVLIKIDFLEKNRKNKAMKNEIELIDGEFGGALDAPDERDFLAGEIADLPGETPDHVVLDHRAQFLESQKMTVSCTAQSATNALEATYFAKTGVSVKIDAFKQWEYQKNIYPKTAGRKGDWTRSAMRALVHRSEHEGGIPATTAAGESVKIKVEGFAKIEKTSYEFRKFIANGHAIQISGDVLRESSSKPSNFRIARDLGTLRFNQDWQKVGGHAVAVLRGYDFRPATKPAHFIGGNSYGEKWGFWKNGTFRLPAEELQNLHMSAFVIFIESPKNAEKIIAAKAILNAKKIQRQADTLAKKFPISSEKCEKIREIAEEIKSIAKKQLKTASRR